MFRRFVAISLTTTARECLSSLYWKVNREDTQSSCSEGLKPARLAGPHMAVAAVVDGGDLQR
jgi:hypothetical protein